MQLDSTTVASLELVTNALTQKSKKGTLFSVLNKCKTPLGGMLVYSSLKRSTILTSKFVPLPTARMLRANLLQPLNDIVTITTRHDSIEALLHNEDAFFQITSQLANFKEFGAAVNSLGTFHVRIWLYFIFALDALLYSDGPEDND